MDTPSEHKSKENWRHRLHEIIYEADTPEGKLFDVILLILILISIVLVMLESVQDLNAKYGSFFDQAEWVITILFTIEYIARIISIKKPSTYIFSFYGIIDLLSTLPKYLSLIFTGYNALLAVRALRLLRVFRILKVSRYIGESNKLMQALKASRAKISVFLFAVLILSVIMGTLMYLVEGEESGFTSIPKSVYWCIVTLTTVGFGDIAPVTPLGQLLATIIMVLGYGIIAVPTGIVSAEYSQQDNKVHVNTQSCPQCNEDKHQDGALFCHRCSHSLYTYDG